MIKIGIANNEDLFFTKDLIKTLLTLANLNVCVISTDEHINELDKNTDVIIMMINQESQQIYEKFNILILNAENNYVQQNHLKKLILTDYLIIDSDNTDFLKTIQLANGLTITCGFNPKSCITTSSVTESEYKTILVCIQHSFKTINNKMIEEQEFSLNVLGRSSNVFSILAAVSCVLICGVEIESIT